MGKIEELYQEWQGLQPKRDICNGMEKQGVAHGKFYWFPQPKTVG